MSINNFNTNDYISTKRKKIKELRRIKKSKKKFINNQLLINFYDFPEKFFIQNKDQLAETSFFDHCGNSIFMHYFNILYEDYKLNNLKISKDKINNNKFLSNIKIYQKNFYEFFRQQKNTRCFG